MTSEGACDATSIEGGQRLAIKVKTLEPATYDLADLTEQTTVGGLKEALQNVTASHVEAERQRILFCGRVLSDDSATLAASGVKDGHTLHMVERPPDVPPQPQNNAPQPQQANARGGLHFSQEFPGAGGVQRIAIGTLNPGGMGLDASGGTPESLISGLMSAINREIQRGGGAATGPAGATANGQAEGAGGVGVGGGGFPPGVHLQQVEINIDAVPASSQGMPINPMNLSPRARVRNIANERHPIQVLNDFIPNVMGIMNEYTSGSFFDSYVVEAGGSIEHEVVNEEAQHIAVECDICGACPIRGPRFKSLSHDNYDLCETCMRTEAAREQEPFVVLEVPLCNQLNTESLIPSPSIPVRQNPSFQRLRTATQDVVTQDHIQRSGRGESVNLPEFIPEVADPISEEETEEQRERREFLDREVYRDQTMQAASVLMRQIASVMPEAEDFCSSFPEAVRIAQEIADPVRREQALHGNLLVNSSVLNALGGMLIEMGRILGGIHLPVPSNRIVLGANLSYIHPNGSQVIVPPPAGGGNSLFGGGLLSGGPGGILESLRATMASRNLGGLSPRAPAPASTAAGQQQQQQPATAASGGAENGQSNRGETTQNNPLPLPQTQVPSVPMPVIPPPAASIPQNIVTPTETPPAQVPAAQAADTINSFPVVVNPDEESSGAGGAAVVNSPEIVSQDPVVPSAANALEQKESGISDGPSMGIDRTAEAASTSPADTATATRAEAAGSGSSSNNTKQPAGLQPGFLKPESEKEMDKAGDDGTKIEKSQDPAEALNSAGASDSKEEEEEDKKPLPKKSKNALGLGLGSGLRPRKTVIRRAKKKDESSSSAPAGPSGLASTSKLPLLPKRNGGNNGGSSAATTVSANPSPNTNANAKSPLEGLMGSFMPMMNQLLGEDGMDSDDDASGFGNRLAGTSGVKEEEAAAVGDSFEASLQQNLTEEEQQRWKALIDQDQLEQEEMRLPEPFSDAYLSLERTNLE